MLTRYTSRIMGLMALFFVAAAIAMPNYFDPNNIIQAHDIFWSFGLNEPGIMKLRHYPTANKELLSKIQNHATAFKEYATKRIEGLENENSNANPDEAHLYKHALNIVEEAQNKAQAILSPTGLNDNDKADLDKIIFAKTAEKKLRLDSKIIKALKKLKTPLMGGSRFEEKVPIRIALEKNHQEITLFLNELTKRPKLSAPDRALIKRARESLESAYEAIHQHAQL